MSKIPKFENIEEESEFWDTHDFTDYLDETTEVDIQFVDNRPVVSFKMNPDILERIKAIAAKRNLVYTTLIKIWLRERLREVEKLESAETQSQERKAG